MPDMAASRVGETPASKRTDDSGFQATANGSNVSSTASAVQKPSASSEADMRQAGGPCEGSCSAARVAAIAYPSSGMNRTGRNSTQRTPAAHVDRPPPRKGQANDSATGFTPQPSLGSGSPD